MSEFLGLLTLVLLLLGVPGEGVHQSLECNDQASAVCLTKGYSTFDLPLRTEPNLIKIGKFQSSIIKYQVSTNKY